MTIHTYTIPAALAGQRLDKALAALLPELTRSQAAILARDGHVQLDGKPAKPAASVGVGQVLIVDVPPSAPTEVVPQEIELKILYEDGDLLVIDKAPGMVVHPAPGNPDNTLVNALVHHLPSLRQVGTEERPGIVHRLDKGTSGVMVVAKNLQSLNELQKQFAGREVSKVYLAIVIGRPRESEGRIDKAIGRHVTDRKRISSVTTAGRPASTLYRVEATKGGISALACTLLSGRTHQIRVHCSESGWPLVGDETYGGIRPLKHLADPHLRAVCQALDRPALHARHLAFFHPRTKERVAFEAAIPIDITTILDQLKEENDD